MDFKSAPPPLIPVQTRQYARRRSLQEPSSLSNQVTIAPASPEVISSLITSLSVISTPANRLFESPIGSHSSPASPVTINTAPFPRLADTSVVSGGSFGKDYGAFNQPSLQTSQTQEESLDELAATSPVIRTAKPPSGLSPLTAPRSPSTRESSPFKSFLRGPSRPSSKGSSQNSRDDASSIGTLSIEPGVAPIHEPRRKSSADSWGKKQAQARSQKGLMYMSSKEALREKELERKKSATAVTSNANGPHRLSLPKLDKEFFMAETAISEEPPTTSEAKGRETPIIQTSSSANASPVEAGVSPALSTGSFTNRAIPARDSSLRKPAAASTKRSSQRSSRHSGKQKTGEDKGHLIEEVDEPLNGRHERSWIDKSALTTEKAQILEPSADLEMPSSQNASTVASEQGLRTAEPDALMAVDDIEEGAPSPTVAQGRTRSPDGARKSIQCQKRWSTNPTPEPAEITQPTRTSSRLKRMSATSSPRTSASYWRNPSNSITQVQSWEPTKSHIHMDDRPTSADSIDDAVEAYLCSPRLSQKIKHPLTGRIISFSEVGDSNGYAVFCCVGMGLTRYITAFYDELALTLKLRLITADRPGVGDSETYNDGTGTPLSWPDDVYAICQALKITKFSILAHSAGAIYALATALRMPQHIRGQIHLLAPWIPPSQMNVFGSKTPLPPTNSLPTSQRILRALPTPILKVANSSFMSATSSSITSSLPKQRKSKRKSGTYNGRAAVTPGLDKENYGRNSSFHELEPSSKPGARKRAAKNPTDPNIEAATLTAAASTLANKERQMTYDTRLTHAIWDLATSGANPAVDLLVCLERRHTIGFRYVDITRAVVIHHGSKDTRVPVENVRWLGKTMKRCEVRILEGEGHGLMASAAVMGGVLMEIAKEWDDWTRVTGSLASKHDTGRKTLREKTSIGTFR